MLDTKLKQLQHGFLAALLASLSTQTVWAQLPVSAVQATPTPIQRAGVQTDKQTLLTLREAVTLALENNREIEIERLNTQLAEQDVRAAKGFYDPALSSSYFYDRQTTPVASILAGGENGRLRTTDFSGTAKLSQQLPWQGGNINLSYDQSRTTSQNLFNALNPQFTSRLMVEFTQPLLRNRQLDAARRQIRIASKKLDLSDSQFRQRAIEIIAQAERAYWDLAFARRDAEIKRESVELARTQLEHNERLAQKGTLAPADVVSAREGEQARNNFEAHNVVVLAARKQVEAARRALLAAKANLDNPAIRTAQTAAIEQQIRQAQADIQSAEAAAARFRAELQEAEANRSDLQIVAPFAGIVATRSAEPGEIVAPGTALMTILNPEQVYLRAFIPEGEIGRVRTGQAARVYLDSNAKQPLEAIVARIDPQASFTPENTYFRDDRIKQVVGVKLQLANPQGFAKSGMPADGEVLVEGSQWVAPNR